MKRALLADTEAPRRDALRVAPLRFVTAASLFDGHDASINVMRRILQGAGAEVIHLGHNRSVREVVSAAVQEDADAVAVSSYQGGHIEYFRYLVDQLRELDTGGIRVFGGGGGVIVPSEVEALHRYGVERIYSPSDGQELGLEGIIDDMIARCGRTGNEAAPVPFDGLAAGHWPALGRLLTQVERGEIDVVRREELARRVRISRRPVVIGITGTGGAGKSSLTDEVVRRFRLDFDDRLRIGILAVDPSRRRTGGALLGDRIRMNAIDHPGIYMRSLATRGANAEIPERLGELLEAMRLAAFDVIIVETSGIGQGDAGVVSHVDVSAYVMTPEYGSASQLEKIEMLDFADVVAINKFDRRGAEDALRDVSKQMQRNRRAFGAGLPMRCRCTAPSPRVSMTTASPPSTRASCARCASAAPRSGRKAHWRRRKGAPRPEPRPSCPPVGCATSPRWRRRCAATAGEWNRRFGLPASGRACARRRRCWKQPARGGWMPSTLCSKSAPSTRDAQVLLDEWPALAAAYREDELVSEVRGREVRTPLVFTTLSGTRVPKVSLPRFEDDGERLRWLMLENLPGRFPFTAGVFALKREGERPSRMFAGEGDAFRTNRRFKLLSAHSPAKRLSTAFDSVTLYGFDPDRRPDIYGKVGNSGVSIATLEDMQALYDGFDLCDAATSVSMTINGPAPTLLAMFLNTAIAAQVARFEAEHARAPEPEERERVRAFALRNVRGTVQADILKEDQGQNTCIFSTEFSLRVMGDIQEYFITHGVRNFYSVSISGYHIAEAGANPISQLAFTLANGFTYVEAYLARGMDVDDFTPNFSFFFSSGMDPEYTVMGRVARRIWATAMRERYGASERGQKLKYHAQTSGRSLHAQEMSFNDIRTTLQALLSTYDHCNSLHTNAYDEAVTTPTGGSVRRALAIQLIINEEWGLARNENPNQGAFIIEELTDLVEEAVLAELERISERGGVLGAMETGYQRGKIQDESLYYESRKHDGTLPIVGVNTFIDEEAPGSVEEVSLARSSEEERESQLARLAAFKARHAAEQGAMVKRLRDAAMHDGNVFAVLMDAVHCMSLGQITDTLFEVGGKYRRNM